MAESRPVVRRPNRLGVGVEEAIPDELLELDDEEVVHVGESTAS